MGKEGVHSKSTGEKGKGEQEILCEELEAHSHLEGRLFGSLISSFLAKFIIRHSHCQQN